MFWKSILERYPSVPALSNITVVTGDALAINTATGLVALADANGTANQARPCVGFAEYGKVGGANSDKYVGIVTKGILDVTSLSLTLSDGSPVYLSNTIRAITNNATGLTTTLQCVGHMIDANTVMIDVNHNYGLATLTTDAVITDYIQALNVTVPKLSVIAKTQRAKGPIMNFDIGAGTTADHVIMNTSVACVVTSIRLVYTEATAAAGVTATTFKIGTAAGGEQLAAAFSPTQPKAVGTYTQSGAIANAGAVAANGTVFCRVTGVVATPIAGEGYIEIEYNTTE